MRNFVYRRLRNKKSKWEITILELGYVEVTFTSQTGQLKKWLFTKQCQISETTLPKAVKKCCHNAFYELETGGII